MRYIFKMFKEIKDSTNWKVIKKIHKGWSKDIKFYIETEAHEKLLLRLSDIATYEQKQKEYEIICKYSKLGFKMSMPIDFGVCHDNQKVYMLLTWVEGEDLTLALPKLDEHKQYELGYEAGEILRQIHNIEVPQEEMPRQTKIPRKQAQLQAYKDSNLRIAGDERALCFVEKNIHKIWSKRPVYQHGDFHPGNLILTPEGRVGVIDFNRWGVGDPYEEFYKLESFGTEVSIPYCRGEIDAYFKGNVPEDFWEILAVYVAHASLHSIKWAEKFGQEDIDKMIKRCQRAFEHYNYFNNIIPSWYND